MNKMFAKATNFNQALNDWDVSSVSNMLIGMFGKASNSNQLFKGTSKATFMVDKS
jgi:hypothetical protein